MRIAICSFVAGVAWLQCRAALPTWSALAFGAALLLACLVVRRPRRRIPLLIAGGALLGFGWAAFLAHGTLADRLAAVDEGRDVTLVGTIDNLPYRFEGGVRFNFVVERVIGVTIKVPRRVALSWYSGLRNKVAAVGDVQPGQRWQLTVRLQRPHGNANPGGFDYEAWLLEQGVRATGYVRADDGNGQLDAFVASPGAVVERVRAALRARIQAALAGRTYAGVIVALVIGDQRGIDQADWQVFNRTGIGHLISISGLHITMIAGLAAWAVSALWRRSFFTDARLPLRLPAQKVAALTGAIVALLYVLLAGFGVPAQRTLYMLSVVALALWMGRLAAVSHVLCAALGVVVLLDPWAVLWPGFWLSFGAVAAILFAGHGRIGPPPAGPRGALLLAGRTQWAVTAGLVPLTLLLFGQVSIVSPVANAVAIPLVSFVVTPLALAGSLVPGPPGDWLLLLAHWTVEMLAWLLRQMAAWPGAVWRAPAPQAWVFALGLGGTLWLLMPRGWPHRWAGAVALLPMLLQLPDHPPVGGFRVTAFDVGQGMALLVETERHRLLYDTGPAYAPGADGGSRVILPYLRMRGIGALDGIVVSHGDTDHSGGALAVLEGVDAGWLASSLPADHAIVRAARRHVRCGAGQHWEWDGITFDMLHPTPASYDDGHLKTNARSCTLRISNGRRTVLLAGDIEAAQEAALLERAPDRLRADVLLAPHHGSGTSSTLAFLQAVRPGIAVFQVGYRNRYHHPKPEVYARYGAIGVERLRTDEAGALTLDFDTDVAWRSYRTAHARYWYVR
ncbi:DNA internalization-related competence protein ComEC/Rec2 [Telluria mixta]|uniref:DNA internalization-related competence protein ComEC/Rec2 n=1 Tax=Telluria mixta TaxID=34071 RepID=A0ABT2C3Z0_9BURK|nr:DNA internalization-related competence protein ComEC/Rec2 [Telluria mixta]MCS0632107.1 DNA internalization-related competence protein ComEC/Rec2 [Telluria mixta]WEM95219.1 DNA internalization-related competence protein ComEC/Rec2 [Telluria mixta]